jgi:alkanesulfonate monooxygenase SsuD/methylene tetrahydromethanopterin reductase-like flavin-dependent oxidoreductase (luciferase family)
MEGIFDLYNATAAEDGWTPTPDHRGYAIRVNVADTDEKAYEEGKNFYWQLGTSFGVTPPHWQAPPGYITKAAASGAREQARTVAGTITPGGPSLPYDEAQATYQIITGSPKTVIEKLKHVIDLIDPGYVVLWGREGPMSHDVAMRSIDLMAQEVIPAIKEYRVDREKGKAAALAKA